MRISKNKLKYRRTRKTNKTKKPRKTRKTGKNKKLKKTNDDNEYRSIERKEFLVVGGDNDDIDYTTLNYEIIKNPYRDDVLLFLKPGQKLFAYFALLVYCNQTIKSEKNYINLKSMVRRSLFAQDKRLKIYTAEDNGRIKFYHGDDEINDSDYDQGIHTPPLTTLLNINEIQDISIDNLYESVLVSNEDAVMLTTGNIDMKVDVSFKGMFTAANTLMPRFDLVNGKVGYVWIKSVPFELVKIEEEEIMMIKPQEFILAKMKNKNYYNIRIKMGFSKINRVLLEVRGPAIVYVRKPDFSETIRKYQFRIQNTK